MAAVTHQAQAIELSGSRSVEAANDHQLLAAIRDGDEVAFQELVRRYRNPITNFVYRMLDDYDRAVELTQETFIRVYTSASRYQANYSFSTYIYRIATNLAISELRRRKRRKTVSLFSPFTNDNGEAIELDPPDLNVLQDEALIENERRLAVARAITSLPQKYRAAIVLRDVEGLSYDQIAQTLKLSEGTVKSRINRARNLLKEKLSAYDETGENMKGCNYIKGLIDEADKPDQFPFEVNEHLAGCGDCERFAGERTALRKLVAAGDRVIAPMNFDAMLNARLAEVKARRSFSWLSAPGYLRLGAATAGLIVMIFAAQYAGLFDSHQKPAAEMRAGTETPPIVPRRNEVTPPAVAEAAPSMHYSAAQRGSRTRQNGAGGRNRVAPDSYFAAEDGGVVLVRGQNGGVDVPMPTVSMGAQPLLYVSAGQRAVRNVGTSF